MHLRKIIEIKNLKGKRILVRVDFNVPVEKGKIKNDFKIIKSLPTINYLLDKGASVILVSHLGRPNGVVDQSLSLRPIAKVLSSFLNKEVKLKSLKELQQKPSNEKIVLLENIRFFPGEEKNDIAFTKELSKLAEIFVSECFAVAHRSSASVTGLAKYLPTYAGLLMAEEVEGIERAVSKPKKPLVVILGGIKTETKIPVLKNFLTKADYILVGGGIASTYFAGKGYGLGVSLLDKDYVGLMKRLGVNKKVIMPVDAVVGQINGAGARLVSLAKPLKLAKNEGIFDVGPATVRLFASYIKKARTLVWNGAMGKFEQHPYEYGTYSLARLFAARSKGKSFGVAGGGETVEILEKLKVAGDVDLVSTGGGAMLEYLSGKILPGVKILKKN
ncbi:MAG: phosphoglycerate kinase [Candidatus Magasanikbacteria bacterium RIFOXYD2_FULL_41_14]|uniref:Phosphoglycerate kinase n=1 Tax=Candidatus Magasanikbacteria bacterium RIFOXYD2_FULL_41_14 TaxID=1798709 RepID=A0A1F6PDV8_9BACT|nr:MAG: phosphoglycerate kinase [Candidatus Magasanikbacteria bacterium RIFOXYD2_FULL_41_14]